MSYEEIQKTIEGMLAVQRELQESQLKLKESQLLHDQQIDRLIGYQETTSRQIGDLTTLIQTLANVANSQEKRIERLEQNL
jgi:uncharacterized protein YjcR